MTGVLAILPGAPVVLGYLVGCFGRKVLERRFRGMRGEGGGEEIEVPGKRLDGRPCKQISNTESVP